MLRRPLEIEMLSSNNPKDNAQLKALPRSAELVWFLLSGVTALCLWLALHPAVTEHFSTHFIGGSRGDGGLYVWLAKTFGSDPLAALNFETNSFYPYPLSRAWSDSFLLPSWLILLLTKLGLSFTAAYNATILLAISLNSAFAFTIARRVKLSLPFAASSAILFANSSYLVGNLGHPQLIFFFWILAAWTAVLPLSATPRVPARRWLIAGVCVACAFYTTVYYAIFSVIGLVIIWLNDLLRGYSSSRRALRTVIFATLGALPIGYALPSYLSVQRYFGTRGLHEAEHFAAKGTSYLAHPPLHDIFPTTASLSHSEAYLSPGYTILALAVLYALFEGWRRSRRLTKIGVLALLVASVASSLTDLGNLNEHALCLSLWVILLAGIISARDNRSVMTVLFVIAVVFFTLSFGPGGNPAKHEPAYSPLGVIYERVPGIASIRAVGRYGSVVVFVIFLTAMKALQTLVGRASNVQRTAISLACVAIGIVENSVSTIPLDSPIQSPQAFSALAKESKSGDVVLVLPFSGALKDDAPASWSEFAILNGQYALWASATPNLDLKMINGYSGQRTKTQLELAKALYNFPSAESQLAIAKICGVKWIVVAPSLIPEFNWDQFESKLASYPETLQLKQLFEDGSALISAQPKLRMEPNQTVTFLADPKRAVSLKVTPLSSEPLSLIIASLGRDAKGATTPIARSEYTATATKTVALTKPRGAPAAAPHIIQVNTPNGGAEVECFNDPLPAQPFLSGRRSQLSD